MGKGLFGGLFKQGDPGARPASEVTVRDAEDLGPANGFDVALNSGAVVNLRGQRR